MGAPRPDDERGVYGISVAAELVGTGVQNLRLYEARGLLRPERTEGGARRDSANDLDRLRRTSDLLTAGPNLAGIGMVVDLEAQNTEVQAERDQQALKTTSIPATGGRKRTSADSTPGRVGPADRHQSAISGTPADLLDDAGRCEQQTPRAP